MAHDDPPAAEGITVNLDSLIVLAARLGMIASGVVLCLASIGTVHL